MRNRTESKSYEDLAQEMADQFQNGENVHAGNLAYLQGFSETSRTSYDWLMNELARMYNVTPRDVAHERLATEQEATKLGGFVITNAL